jgi:hypothetical protein
MLTYCDMLMGSGRLHRLDLRIAGVWFEIEQLQPDVEHVKARHTRVNTSSILLLLMPVKSITAMLEGRAPETSPEQEAACIYESTPSIASLKLQGLDLDPGLSKRDDPVANAQKSDHAALKDSMPILCRVTHRTAEQAASARTTLLVGVHGGNSFRRPPRAHRMPCRISRPPLLRIRLRSMETSISKVLIELDHNFR